MNRRLTSPIDQLKVPTRAFTCLRALRHDPTWQPPTEQISTVADLARWTAADLLRLKGMGQQSVQEIVVALRDFGVVIDWVCTTSRASAGLVAAKSRANERAKLISIVRSMRSGGLTFQQIGAHLGKSGQWAGWLYHGAQRRRPAWLRRGD
jgi:hypothetical protein